MLAKQRLSVSLLATGVFAAVSPVATAQVPNGAVVVSRFSGTTPGGLSYIAPGSSQVVDIAGVPADLTGLPVTSPANGASSVLVDGRTGNLIVGEHTPAGQLCELHLLTLAGDQVVSDQRYPLVGSTGNASVDQMAWFGEDIVFNLRGSTAGSALSGNEVGIFRPRLGPPGTPGVFVPVPLTQSIGTINALAVDEVRGLAYVARVVGLSVEIYSVSLLGNGVPVTPTLVTTATAIPLNMAYTNDTLWIGSAWGDRLQRIDLSVSPPMVAGVPGVVQGVNGLAVNNATGDVMAVNSSPGDLFRVDAGFGISPVASLQGVPSGVAIRQSMATYGFATGPSPQAWQLAANPGGAPTVGNASFDLSIDAAAGGGITAIGLSLDETVPLPMFGVSVFVDPSSLLLQTLPANATSLPIPIPNNQALLGFELYAQAFCVDAAGWSASRGLRVTVLP